MKRPSPRDVIANECGNHGTHLALAALAAHGYSIVETADIRRIVAMLDDRPMRDGANLHARLRAATEAQTREGEQHG
jgi:hypothetical protein